ncbi:hypothetical protein CVT24_013105 [Panaeolus cyanescens]|uniref:CRAL-TRIO domain-containing protein n=1 Tax=Panaeolus cyanescens TaxID=181874 RepID=A0A409YN50_9AGAR|nr:hypothetical protein CVT24_013105 [Panaeolus cyanescens]
MTTNKTAAEIGSSASGLPTKLEHGPLFTGHMNNLTSDQEKALAAFKESLTSVGLYKPASPESESSHNDPTLLRFLRARSWDVTAAQKQFSDAEKWRAMHQVDDLFISATMEELEDSKRFYPRWTGRRDKNGIPLYVYRLNSLEAIQNELYAIPAKTRYHRIIVLYELMTRFTFPLCSNLPRRIDPIPVSSTTTIIDLENVSFGSMWKLRHHLQEASKLSTANYPETLHSIAIVNSPSFFPTIWNWIKGWFDEGTRQKIHVLGRDLGSALRELVDAENLPKVYGGELEWVFTDEPSLDGDTKQLIGEMPKGAVIFANGKTLPATST